MALDRLKAKSRAYIEPIAAIPKALLESEEYAALTAFEVKLLLDLAAQFNGYTNNGDLGSNWKEMRKRGWRSKETLWNALAGLLSKGFITKTRQGGKNRCSLYAVNWREIHECKGKIDVRPGRDYVGRWRKKSVLRQPGNAATPAVPVGNKK